jgi:hypothetical protein
MNIARAPDTRSPVYGDGTITQIQIASLLGTAAGRSFRGRADPEAKLLRPSELGCSPLEFRLGNSSAQFLTKKLHALRDQFRS